jgi:DNA-binding CsgD family transcriptional regulator/tetratricopeptide (TPR) repeat protein
MRAASPELIGRDAEFEDLRSALRRAADGCPGLVFLVGDAGIGKTRLMSEVEDLAVADGFVVLRGDCVDLAGGELPYAPIAAAIRHANPTIVSDALDQLSVAARRDLADIIPGLDVDAESPAGSAPGDVTRHRLFARLSELLRVVADSAPALLVLEDLHWADQSTLDFLSYLVRDLREERIAIAATVRSEPLALEVRAAAPPREVLLRQTVAGLRRLPSVERIDLRPLGPHEVARQLAGILGHVPSRQLADDISRRSDGVPYYVEELVAAGAMSTASELPPSVREAVLVRVEDLSHDARAALGAVAGFARPVTYELLAKVTRLRDVSLGDALREGLAAHLLARDGDDAFAFRHALAREAVYESLMPDERSHLHMTIAAALETVAEQTTAAEVARHWDGAGERHRAFPARVQAGTAADAMHAPAEALAHYERALALWDEVGDRIAYPSLDRRALVERAAGAAFLAEQDKRCSELWSEALELTDPGAEPLHAAWLHERLGRSQPWHMKRSLAHYGDGLELLPDGPSAERSRLLAAMAFDMTFQHRWQEASDRAEEALAMARAVGARAEEITALSTIGVSLAFLGRYAEGEADLRAALKRALLLDSADELVGVHLDRAEVRRLRGDRARALKITAQAGAIAKRAGMESKVHFITVNLAEDLYCLGQWDEAQHGIDAMPADGLAATVTLIREGVAGRLCTGWGAFEQADEHFARAVEMCEQVEAKEAVHAVRAGMAELALWRGRVAEAAEHVCVGLKAIGDVRDPLHAPVLFSMGLRVEADAAADRRLPGRRAAPEAAADRSRLLEQLDKVTDGHRDADGGGEAMAHRALCVAELARVHDDPAPDLWEAAAAAWEKLAQPYSAAYARWREGEARLSVAGGRPAARRALRQAREWAAALPAPPLVATIDGLARAAHLDISAEQPAPRPKRRVPEPAEALGLTARELEVLCLLAEGLTDRQIADRLFISRRTAQVHAARVRNKLGVDNRTAAAGVARRLGLIEEEVAPR